ncbi:MAG: DUF3630 family protein [Pseudomonas sp.]|nr:DUF3630 family protein [Pseudomonas sp.]
MQGNAKWPQGVTACSSLRPEPGSHSPWLPKKYVRQIGASVLAKIETPDMHLWEIEYSGATLNLVYEDFPNGVSIEPKDNRGQSAIDTLYSLAMEQKSQNGL